MGMNKNYSNLQEMIDNYGIMEQEIIREISKLERYGLMCNCSKDNIRYFLHIESEDFLPAILCYCH